MTNEREPTWAPARRGPRGNRLVLNSVMAFALPASALVALLLLLALASLADLAAAAHLAADSAVLLVLVEVHADAAAALQRGITLGVALAYLADLIVGAGRAGVAAVAAELAGVRLARAVIAAAVRATGPIADADLDRCAFRPGSQAAHASPPVPQDASVAPLRQRSLSSQQPSPQLVESQTHSPPTTPLTATRALIRVAGDANLATRTAEVVELPGRQLCRRIAATVRAAGGAAGRRALPGFADVTGRARRGHNRRKRRPRCRNAARCCSGRPRCRSSPLGSWSAVHSRQIFPTQCAPAGARVAGCPAGAAEGVSRARLAIAVGVAAAVGQFVGVQAAQAPLKQPCAAGHVIQAAPAVPHCHGYGWSSGRYRPRRRRGRSNRSDNSSNRRRRRSRHTAHRSPRSSSRCYPNPCRSYCRPCPADRCHSWCRSTDWPRRQDCTQPPPCCGPRRACRSPPRRVRRLISGGMNLSPKLWRGDQIGFRPSSVLASALDPSTKPQCLAVCGFRDSSLIFPPGRAATDRPGLEGSPTGPIPPAVPPLTAFPPQNLPGAPVTAAHGRIRQRVRRRRDRYPSGHDAGPPSAAGRRSPRAADSARDAAGLLARIWLT